MGGGDAFELVVVVAGPEQAARVISYCTRLQTTIQTLSLPWRCWRFALEAPGWSLGAHFSVVVGSTRS